MDKHIIIEKLKNYKTTLSDFFGIEAIGLFGSYAKGCASIESDIDLIYITKEGVRIGFGKKIQLEEYLSQLFQPSKIDLVNYKYINPIIRSDVEKYIIYV